MHRSKNTSLHLSVNGVPKRSDALLVMSKDFMSAKIGLLGSRSVWPSLSAACLQLIGDHMDEGE